MTKKTSERLKIKVFGTIQGVGFRPHAFKLAQKLDLSGFVCNDGAGAMIEVEGDNAHLFAQQLSHETPPGAVINEITVESILSKPDAGFLIETSLCAETKTRIGPDVATCPDCLTDLFNPDSRFYHYPFVTCAYCGPRFTVTQALPYDRARTSMASFAMCAACAKDYADPNNRRFHAQSLACPKCGPRLNMKPKEIAQAIRAGKIIALKGVGGFHLICDARRSETVARLRQRKNRDAKPFAVMVANCAALSCIAIPTDSEMRLAASPAAPIVIMKPKPGLPQEIAPGLSRIGVFLAYTPIHHLLFSCLAEDAASGDGDVALVITSANVGGEPLIIDNDAAHHLLKDIADLIVAHDRPIVTPADDSVMSMIDNAPVFLRRARGFAPEPIDLGDDGPSVIAFGAHQKTTITITRGREAFVSQHIGDLDGSSARQRYHEIAQHLLDFLGVKPEAAACDLHPDFPSTRIAEEAGLPLLRVQHHAAHIAAVAAEYQHQGPLLGAALDGYGYGDDGGAWGGELISVVDSCWRRIGHLAPMPLPGGDRAAREIWRMGLAAAASANRLNNDVLHQLAGVNSHATGVAMMLRTGQTPQTTSLGRLFDAAAAILGLRDEQSEEAQAAMELEALAHTPICLPGGYRIDANILDFTPLLAHFIDARPTPVEGANLLHGTVAAGLAEWINRAAQTHGCVEIALAGGCMTNRILAEGVCERLRAHGQTPLLPRRVPANDGGLSLGQALLARRALLSGKLRANRNNAICASQSRSA
jgi:hydrogenase maturation protein HypF